MKLMRRIISLLSFAPTNFSKPLVPVAVCLLEAPPDNNINEQVADEFSLKNTKES